MHASLFRQGLNERHARQRLQRTFPGREIPQVLLSQQRLGSLARGIGRDGLQAGAEPLPCLAVLAEGRHHEGLGQQADSIGLFDFVGRAMSQVRFPLALFCDLTGDPKVIRTVCRPEPGPP